MIAACDQITSWPEATVGVAFFLLLAALAWMSLR